MLFQIIRNRTYFRTRPERARNKLKWTRNGEKKDWKWTETVLKRTRTDSKGTETVSKRTETDSK